MNVLMVATTFIPSVLLCGHCQLSYMEDQGVINYRFVPSHFVKKKNVEWADVIVFGRSDADIDAYVAKIAKKAGKHLVYFLDDDILNVPKYIVSSPYYLLPSTQKNVRATMANCDTFLTPSPVLQEKYGKGFKHSYLISEPSLNRIDKKESNGKVKIGFAGSIDRAQDINEILEEAIRQIVAKYGDAIEIEFMGAKPSFLEELGLKYLPYQDGYDAYTAYMARCNWDIGLAPMPLTEFHRCKYFNKFVEYASFGIVGVYTNCEPYVFGIRDRVNGLLVNNTTEEWANAISELIDNEQLRKKMSDECLREADEIYSLRVLAPDYYAKMINDFKIPEKYGKIPNFAFAKTTFFFKRVYRKIKEQGKDFPEWLQKKIDTKLEERRENKQFDKNTEKLEKMVKEKKMIFVFAPIYDEFNSETDYEKRVKYFDDNILNDYYIVYLNGENRLLEHINTTFADDRHANVIFNSYDIHQAERILSFIEQSGVCMIHSVIRFLREKLSNEMYKVFDMKDVITIWDTHGAIPEEYGKASNVHTEMVTNEIEKVFYEKSDVIICDSKELIDHFKNKYQERKMEYIVCPSEGARKRILSLIEKKTA